MTRQNCFFLIAAFMFSLFLFGCGGAEDGDLTPPNFTVDSSIPAVTDDPGTLGSPHAFFGTSDPGSEVEVTVTFPTAGTTSAVTTPVVLADGSWSFDLYGLVEGSNTIAIDVADPIGNSTIYYVTIFLDLTGPVVTIDQYFGFTTSLTQTLAGTVAELDAQDVEVSIDGGTNWTSADDINGGIWTFDVTFPTDTTIYDVRVRGKDILGNFPSDPDDSLVVQQFIEVDSVLAPDFTVTQPLPIYISPDPTTTLFVDLDGTFDSANYSLTFSTSTVTTLTPDTTVSDVWSLNVDDLPSGITVAAVGVNDLTPAEVAQAKVMIVRDLSGPFLIETIPAHGDKNVIVGTDITLTFSEDMSSILGVNGDFIELVADDGSIITFSTDPSPVDARTFAFTPDVSTPLQATTTYTLNFVSIDPVLSVADIYSNEFERPSGSIVFTTQ